MAFGKKTGGRTKGVQNRASVAKAAAVAASGLTPLDYMLTVMRDKKIDGTRRDEMAKASAPYIHPKLSAVQVSGPNDGPIQFSVDVASYSDEKLAQLEALVANLAGASIGDTEGDPSGEGETQG